MKIITKEISVEELIINVKENWENSEKYFLLSTKEMHNQIKMNLEVFCPKIKSATLNCLIEKVSNEFAHPLIVIELDAKFVKKEELEQFTQIHKEIFPIIPVHNYDDYNNKDDVGWFLKKIIGIEDNNKNLTVTDEDSDFFNDEDNLGLSKVNYNFTMRKCARTFLEKGIGLHNKGKHDQSLKLLKIANTLDKTFFTLFQLATFYFQLKNHARSIKYVEESLKLNNKFSQARFLLGLCFFKQGEFERAITEIEKIDKKTVRKRDVLDIELQLGKMNMIMGNNEKSIKYFKNAEEIVPKKLRYSVINQILFFKFSFHREVNDHEQCCNILEVLIKRSPTEPSYLAYLGMTKLSLGKYEESEKCFIESLNMNKKYAYPILPFLGLSYIKQNDISKAYETFKKCIPLKDEIPSDVYSTILEALEKFPELLERLKKVHRSMGLNEVLDLTNSKDNNVKSIQNDYDHLLTHLTRQSENTIADTAELPTVSIEQLRRTDVQCLEIMRQIIRKKYSGNINLLKDDKDLFSNGYGNNKPEDNYVYTSIEKNMIDREDAIQEQKPINDLFDCLDFGNFPFIILRKYKSWKFSKHAVELLKTIASSRNTPAHHSGPDELGNLSTLDANLHYITCRKIIVYFEDKMKI
jgi:tetratricopeptide (TPR) repeat protein